MHVCLFVVVKRIKYMFCVVDCRVQKYRTIYMMWWNINTWHTREYDNRSHLQILRLPAYPPLKLANFFSVKIPFFVGHACSSSPYRPLYGWSSLIFISCLSMSFSTEPGRQNRAFRNPGKSQAESTECVVSKSTVANFCRWCNVQEQTNKKKKRFDAINVYWAYFSF